jgi:hypothetical protein
MTTDPAPLPDPPGFGSLAALEARHAELVRANPALPADLETVKTFITRAVDTGTVLDAPDERSVAQGLINFWVSRLACKSRGRWVSDSVRLSASLTSGSLADDGSDDTEVMDPPDCATAQVLSFEQTVLKPFRVEALRAAQTAADAWLRDAGGDRDLARRVLLRLIRLRPEGEEFDPVPTVRIALSDLDSPERVTAVLGKLVELGVIRRKAGEIPDLDQFSLRAPEQSGEWATLTEWKKGRLRFRSAVTAWAALGRSDAFLAEGEQLDEGRRYHDRNQAERDYVIASAYQQARRLERADADRRAKWIWRSTTLIAVLGWSLAWVGCSDARRETIRANGQADQARAEKDRADAEADRARTEKDRADAETIRRVRVERERQAMIEIGATAESTSTLAVAALLLKEDRNSIHAAKKLLIIQTLRHLLFAANGEAAQIARQNWNLLEKRLAEEDPSKVWFSEYLRTTWAPQIARITSGPPLDKIEPGELREKVKALQALSRDLKKYIITDTTKEVLTFLRPQVVAQACRCGERLAKAAAEGLPLRAVRVERLAYWRLVSSSFILSDDDELLAATDELARALEAWEKVYYDQKIVAPPEVVEAVRRGWERVQTQCNRFPSK